MGVLWVDDDNDDVLVWMLQACTSDRSDAALD